MRRMETYFKMVPNGIFPQFVRNVLELLSRHLGERIVVDNSSAVIVEASDDIACRWLRDMVSTDAMMCCDIRA